MAIWTSDTDEFYSQQEGTKVCKSLVVLIGYVLLELKVRGENIPTRLPQTP